jgi:3-oxoacyl-[acyl-carrier protein] reductase
MSSPPPLQGRRALVCGASAGIGRATALALAARGAQVIGLARRADRLAALADAIGAAGMPALVPLVADLDDRPALIAAVRAELERGGPVHVLINNAGGPPGGPLLQADDAAFVHAFGRHLLAPQALLRLLVPGMAAAGFGRVVNVLSTSVYEPIAGLGVSNTVRAAVAGWAKTLADELPPGVTINNLLPGFTDTERLGELARARASAAGSAPDAVRAAWVGAVPEGRLADPAETAAAIAFLCSPEAGYIRGVSLPVDGGRLRGI